MSDDIRQDAPERPRLVRWKFDDPIHSPLCDLVDVTIDLSDGTRRWCFVATPDYLKQLLEPRSDPAQWGGAYEPAVWGAHLIVCRRVAETEVDWLLRFMDEEGGLLEATLPYGNDLRCQPKLVRSTGAGGHVEYTIREVYFLDDEPKRWFAENPITPGAPTVEALRVILDGFLKDRSQGVIQGENGHIYGPAEVLGWLRLLDEPPIEFES